VTRQAADNRNQDKPEVATNITVGMMMPLTNCARQAPFE